MKPKFSKKKKTITYNADEIHYKFSPFYKYALFLLIVYMFIKHQKIMSQEKLLTNSLIITLIICLLDYIIIDNHPHPFMSNILDDSSDEDCLDDDYFDDIDDFDNIEYDVSIEDDIRSLNNSHQNNGYQNNPYQNNSHQNNGCQNNGYQNNPYQNNARQYYNSGMVQQMNML